METPTVPQREERFKPTGGVNYDSLIMVSSRLKWHQKSLVISDHWQELPQVSFLSRQKFCHDKHTFVMTKVMFCRNKHMFVVTNTFVTTKIILVAAPTNDSTQAKKLSNLTEWGVEHNLDYFIK